MSEDKIIGFNIRIDATKIDKKLLYPGKPVERDGKTVTPQYLNMTGWRVDEAKWNGAHYKIEEELSDSDKEFNKTASKSEKIYGTTLGTAKKILPRGTAAPAQAQTQVDSSFDEDDEDLPF